MGILQQLPIHQACRGEDPTLISVLRATGATVPCPISTGYSTGFVFREVDRNQSAECLARSIAVVASLAAVLSAYCSRLFGMGSGRCTPPQRFPDRYRKGSWTGIPSADDMVKSTRTVGHSDENIAHRNCTA